VGGPASEKAKFQARVASAERIILSHSDGTERWVCFWFFFWCAGIVGAVFPDSRLGGFNSRLGANKFPFCPLRELAGKDLIYLAVSGAETALMANNRENSRFEGKTGNCVSAYSSRAP
jgi:hypothetical protein